MKAILQKRFLELDHFVSDIDLIANLIKEAAYVNSQITVYLFITFNLEKSAYAYEFNGWYGIAYSFSTPNIIRVCMLVRHLVINTFSSNK